MSGEHEPAPQAKPRDDRFNLRLLLRRQVPLTGQGAGLCLRIQPMQVFRRSLAPLRSRAIDSVQSSLNSLPGVQEVRGQVHHRDVTGHRKPSDPSGSGVSSFPGVPATICDLEPPRQLRCQITEAPWRSGPHRPGARGQQLHRIAARQRAEWAGTGGVGHAVAPGRSVAEVVEPGHGHVVR